MHGTEENWTENHINPQWKCFQKSIQINQSRKNSQNCSWKASRLSNSIQNKLIFVNFIASGSGSGFDTHYWSRSSEANTEFSSLKEKFSWNSRYFENEFEMYFEWISTGGGREGEGFELYFPWTNQLFQI